MTITPELLTLLSQHETIEALANVAGFVDSELPEVVKPNKLDPFQRELWRHNRQLKLLQRALSPNTLNAVAADSPRRSNFDNVGRPAPEW